jgi:hypothetical protein
MSEVLAPTAQAPLTKADLPEVVQRYLQGASLRELAAEYQSNWWTLYRWLLTYDGEEYRELVTNALCARVANADLDLDTASDKCSIARAREKARFSRMDLERRRPREYGQAPAAVSQVNIIVDRSCGLQPIDIPAKVVNGSE